MDKKLLLSLFFLLSCSNSRLYLNQGITMGTYYRIKVYASANPQEVFQKARVELKRLEEKFSDYDLESEISRINQQAGLSKVKVSQETIDLLREAISISEKTEGAFDPTVRPLMEIWGFKEGKQSPPPSEKISETLQVVGWERLRIGKEGVMLERKGMELDLGGIAKGYAVDKVVELLKEAGIRQALVEIGGELYCLGSGPGSNGWKIGIQDPQSAEGIIAVLQVIDQAVATSGSYENFYIWEGKRYSHIIDPRSGFPVQNSLISVTIISSKCMEADAWATALFVLGWERAQEIVEKEEDLEAILIRERNGKMQAWVSSGLRERVELDEERVALVE